MTEYQEMQNYILSRTKEWKLIGSTTRSGYVSCRIRHMDENSPCGIFELSSDGIWLNVDLEDRIIACGQGLEELKKYCQTSIWGPSLNFHYNLYDHPRFK